MVKKIIITFSHQYAKWRWWNCVKIDKTCYCGIPHTMHLYGTVIQLDMDNSVLWYHLLQLSFTKRTDAGWLGVKPHSQNFNNWQAVMAIYKSYSTSRNFMQVPPSNQWIEAARIFIYCHSLKLYHTLIILLELNMKNRSDYIGMGYCQRIFNLSRSF